MSIPPGKCRCSTKKPNATASRCQVARWYILGAKIIGPFKVGARANLAELLLGHLATMLKNLHPHTLRRQLHIQNRTHAALPRLLQAEQLALTTLLREFPLSVDVFRCFLGVGQFLFDAAQDILQLGVTDQPRIFAVLFQQGQILMALGEVGA